MTDRECFKFMTGNGDITSADANGNATNYRSIILQLKSSQDNFALFDMHTIISCIRDNRKKKIYGEPGQV